MNELKKQTIIDLLDAAKAHLEAGETAAAIEKIEAAKAEVENEGVEPASEEDGEETDEEGKPKDPPLPGQGTNGGRT